LELKLRRMRILALLLLIAASSANAQPAERQVILRDELARAFSEIGTDGTFVMLELSKNRITVVNAERHTRGFLPASTFKIPNALIAL
jgi:beta-lactamase class D